MLNSDLDLQLFNKRVRAKDCKLDKPRVVGIEHDLQATERALKPQGRLTIGESRGQRSPEVALGTDLKKGQCIQQTNPD